MSFRLRNWTVLFVVAVLTFIIFLPALNNDFIRLDDSHFVYMNYHITQIDFNFFKWIFTNREAQWSPLRWISYAIDYKIWKFNPTGYHLTNIILHSLNAFLVALTVIKLIEIAKAPQPTHSKEKEGYYFQKNIFIAGIATGLFFGLHPIHIESVVWISERKDVLYSFFFLLSLIFYLKYSVSFYKKQRIFYYLLCIFCFILSVMSKAMAVILPLVLIILDIYPLKRFKFNSILNLRQNVFFEKIPFFMISIAVMLINMNVHEELGHLVSLHTYTLTERISVSFISLITYLIRMIWPFQLTHFQPYPDEISLFSFDFIGSLFLVIAITLFSFWAWRKGRKIWLIVWLYYFIGLLPILVFRVAGSYMPDRYVYIASIGPLMLIGIGISTLWEKSSLKNQKFFLRKKIFLWSTLSIILCILSILTIKQTFMWENTFTLFNQVKDQYASETYLIQADSYATLSDFQNAELFYKEALKIAKEENNYKIFLDALYRLGFLYMQLEQTNKAKKVIDLFEKIAPNSVKHMILKGYYAYLSGDTKTAVIIYNNILKNIYSLDIADKIYIYTLLGDAYRDSGLYRKAIENYTEALRLYSSFPAALHGIAKTYLLMGDFESAEEYLNVVIKIDPYNFKALSDMALNVLIKYKHPDKALPFAKKAVSLNPPLYHPYLIMGTILIAKGEESNAENYFVRAKDFEAPSYLLLYSKGWAYYLRGNKVKQAQYFRKITQLNLVPYYIQEGARKMEE